MLLFLIGSFNELYGLIINYASYDCIYYVIIEGK